MYRNTYRKILIALWTAMLFSCGPAPAYAKRMVHSINPFHLVLLQEAASEPMTAKVVIAGIIRDRAKDKRWPNTVTLVITQKAQFTGMVKPLVPYNKEDLLDVNMAIRISAAGLRPCGQGVFWYHANYIKPPDWTITLKKRCEIGKHICGC